jgi:hypothetical protein
VFIPLGFRHAFAISGAANRQHLSFWTKSPYFAHFSWNFLLGN